ncbi:hypothetical protein N7528_001949 [Penicillium herquei]|nr:hypothetical protein N7528_001949 [Penicillium herquei]
MITGIAHVNITVHPGTLNDAQEFYSTILGLTPSPVPELQKGTILWFDIGSSGQQIHITEGPTDPEHRRHPCFKLGTQDELETLKKAIHDHHIKGVHRRRWLPINQEKWILVGTQAKEYPKRFFARDYAGNLLEFTL